MSSGLSAVHGRTIEARVDGTPMSSDGGPVERATFSGAHCAAIGVA
jgi:hypothetical protein